MPVCVGIAGGDMIRATVAILTGIVLIAIGMWGLME